jgi:hypothetical protein
MTADGRPIATWGSSYTGTAPRNRLWNPISRQERNAPCGAGDMADHHRRPPMPRKRTTTISGILSCSVGYSVPCSRLPFPVYRVVAVRYTRRPACRIGPYTAVEPENHRWRRVPQSDSRKRHWPGTHTLRPVRRPPAPPGRPPPLGLWRPDPTPPAAPRSFATVRAFRRSPEGYTGSLPRVHRR